MKIDGSLDGSPRGAQTRRMPSGNAFAEPVNLRARERERERKRERGGGEGKRRRERGGEREKEREKEFVLADSDGFRTV